MGLWAGTGGEGAKFWMSVLTDLRNRGVRDVFFVVCDGLKGLPDVVANVWPPGDRADLHHPPDPQHVPALQPRGTGTRSSETSARSTPPSTPPPPGPAFDELAETWGERYPAIVRLWDNAWDEFIPFLDYDIEIRPVLCSTNAIESLNARYRRAIKARGHFPSEQAALKCLYLVTRSLDPTGEGRQRWAKRWKPALNAFSITFADRFPAAETY